MFTIIKKGKPVKVSSATYYRWISSEMQDADDEQGDSEEAVYYDDDSVYNCPSNDPIYNCPNDDSCMSPIISVPDVDFVHSASISHADAFDNDDLPSFQSDEYNESILKDEGVLEEPDYTEHAYVGNDDLYLVMTRHHLSRTAKDAILKVLRSYTRASDLWSLPCSFKTTVRPYPEFKVTNIDADDINFVDESMHRVEHVEETGEKEVNKVDRGGCGSLVYFGIRQAMKMGIAKFDAEEMNLYMAMNADGVKLFMKSRKGFWTILGQFVSNPVFTIALYLGPGKPKSHTAFLKDYVEEVLDIPANGFLLNGRVYRIYLWTGVFDSPARAFVLNIPQFNSYEGCHRCKVTGIYHNHRMCFLDTDAPARILDTESSILFKILHQVRVLFDIMHLVDLGATKKLLSLWTGSECSITPAQKKRVSVVDLPNYKAIEFRQFLLYTCIVSIEGFISSTMYKHLLSFHVAYRILNDRTLIQNEEMLRYAETLLRNFVNDFPHIYPPEYTTYTIHALIHLPDDVRLIKQPLVDFSGYSFEDHNGKYKVLVKSSKSPGIQVARRMYEAAIFEERIPSTEHQKEIVVQQLYNRYDHNDQEKFRSCTKCFETRLLHFHANLLADRFCEIERGKVFMVEHFLYKENVPYVSGMYVPSLQNYYDIPCTSKSVGVFCFNGDVQHRYTLSTATEIGFRSC